MSITNTVTLIRTHKAQLHAKRLGDHPSDMPAEYKDYGYWTVPYFQQKASAVGPSTRALIDAVIRKYAYPVQSFRSCFGILRYAEKYSSEALERCCKDAVLAGNATTPISVTRSQLTIRSPYRILRHRVKAIQMFRLPYPALTKMTTASIPLGTC